MAKPKTCSHSRFNQKCRSCRALRDNWYEKLRADGFVDIEYGREDPRYTTSKLPENMDRAEESAAFYRRVWLVYHAWIAWGRSRRDCRIAELYAAQDGDNGTVRGIARNLKIEGLPPWSTTNVQATLKEIREAVAAGVELKDDNVIKSMHFAVRYHKAA